MTRAALYRSVFADKGLCREVQAEAKLIVERAHLRAQEQIAELNRRRDIRPPLTFWRRVCACLVHGS